MNCLRTISVSAPLTSPPAPPLEINHGRMVRSKNDLLVILSGYLPTGCHEWASAHRPDVIRFLAEAEKALDAACSLDDHGAFISAVSYCSGLYLRVAVIFRMELKRAQRLTYSVQAEG